MFTNHFSIQFPTHLTAHIPDQGPVSNKNLFQTAQKSLSNSSKQKVKKQQKTVFTEMCSETEIAQN